MMARCTCTLVHSSCPRCAYDRAHNFGFINGAVLKIQANKYQDTG